MKEFKVRESEAGQSVWKYITKLMPGASASLLRKSLRKKNITLNDRKLEGKEKIQAGDSIKIWFSDETIDKFMGKEEKVPERKADGDELSGRIVYEDHDVLLVNKPAGLLTQGDASGEKSLNDEILAYLKDEVTPVFKPSVCNRLDRNTSGLVIAGKNIHALQAMNEIIRKRDVRKIYTALVYGEMKGKGKLEGYLKKDHEDNQVRLVKKSEDAQHIEILYEAEETYRKEGITFTRVEIELLTGRSHQIRVQMAGKGHPLLGDKKYGTKESIEASRELGIKRQVLHAGLLSFPAFEEGFEGVSGKSFRAPLPEDMEKLIQK